MSTLTLDGIAKVLSSETNREIIKLLHKKNMTNIEIYEQMKTKIVCRESIFKALKKLVNNELVEKVYSKDKRVRYKLTHSKYVLDLKQETVEPKKKKREK